MSMQEIQHNTANQTHGNCERKTVWISMCVGPNNLLRKKVESFRTLLTYCAL